MFEQPVTLIAELSGNHQGLYAKAADLVLAAARAGAHAVKLQTYTADTLTLPCEDERFRVRGGLWDGRTLHNLYTEASTPWEWQPKLARLARSLGMQCFSTPFDESAVDFLEAELRPPCYKVSSFEVTHLPLLRKVAATGKPVLLSTGMATAEEIDTAVTTLRDGGCPDVTLLKCISTYPADPRGFNLRALPSMAERWKCRVGLSDHSLGHEVVLGAVSLGATVIEKHLCLSRAEGAIDSGFSLEPDEFAAMCEQVSRLNDALDGTKLGPAPAEREAGQLRFRRSIFVSAPIRAGEAFTADNVKIIRPADGLAPSSWDAVLGTMAACDLTPGTPLQVEHLASVARVSA